MVVTAAAATAAATTATAGGVGTVMRLSTRCWCRALAVIARAVPHTQRTPHRGRFIGGADAQRLCQARSSRSSSGCRSSSSVSSSSSSSSSSSNPQPKGKGKGKHSRKGGQQQQHETEPSVKLPRMPRIPRPPFASALFEEAEEQLARQKLEDERKADPEAAAPEADPKATCKGQRGEEGVQEPCCNPSDRGQDDHDTRKSRKGTAKQPKKKQGTKPKGKPAHKASQRAAGELKDTVTVTPVHAAQLKTIIQAAEDVPPPAKGPLSSLPHPDIEAIVKAFGLRNMYKPSRPYAASLRKFVVADYGVADAFASLIPGLQKLHIVEMNPNATLFTRALLNHGAKSVVTVSNTTDRQNKHIRPLIKSYQDIVGEQRLEFVLGDMQKLDLPDGCPPSERLFGRVQPRQWLVRSPCALAGQTNTTEGSLFLFTYLYKMAMRTGPFHWGRTSMYLILPRYMTQHIFSSASRLGVLTQALCHVKELAAVSRDLFRPNLVCTEGPASVTVHFVEITPRYKPLTEDMETFVCLDFLLRHMHMTANTIGRATRALGKDYAPLLEMANVDPNTPLASMRFAQYVGLARALKTWDSKPVSAIEGIAAHRMEK